ncbi:hypothetical protein C2G38_2067128 [Gigaspora rosea]|uniref:Uncharacterized protein n=1 Tax=Gigaspora rosea TaxID=44941 RepID=A0A397VUY3_9GLOM|nr:hypothetical protein C2G38_2067128 [Gigaspora rosea]
MYNASDHSNAMEIYAYDKEYDLYPKYDEQSVSPFEESLYWKNAYVLMDRSQYFFKFKRIIRYSVIPDIWSYFGRPNYNEQPYIESTIQIIQPNFTASSSQQTNRIFYAQLYILADPKIRQREEIEQKDKTVLNLLGILGGIWSAITGFYIFLFGLGLISPWGFVQRLKPFRNEYEKGLLPYLVDSQSDEYETEEKSDTKDYRISSILNRLEKLEKINQLYKECIIDSSFLSFAKWTRPLLTIIVVVLPNLE